MATATQTKTTVTVKAADLHSALKATVLFATKVSEMLPMLAAVKFEVRDGQLITASTDRFRIGMVRTAVDQESEVSSDFSVLVNRPDVENMVRVLAAPKASEPWRMVTLETTVDASERKHVSFRTTDGNTGSFIGLDLDFPKYQFLIPEDKGPVNDQESDRHSFGVNPSYMADFAKAATALKAHSMIVEPTEANRPAAIRIGSRFLGLIMPVRVNDTDVDSFDTRAAWRTILGK